MNDFTFDDLVRYSSRENGVDISKMQEFSGKFGYNGGIGCDVISGPCSCGAWHFPDEEKEDIISFSKEILSSEKFAELMESYQAQRLGPTIYFSKDCVRISYDPRGKLLFLGPRKAIFNLEEKVAKDLGLEEAR